MAVVSPSKFHWSSYCLNSKVALCLSFFISRSFVLHKFNNNMLTCLLLRFLLDNGIKLSVLLFLQVVQLSCKQSMAYEVNVKCARQDLKS